jgi:hypothetical protein
MKPSKELWFRAEDANYCETRLQPGLYRPREKGATRKPIQKLLEYEVDMYDEFDRCGTQLSPGDAWSLDDDWTSYFMMQHHGVPTRVLDWSDGALIALHFAVSHMKDLVPKSDSIVYVLDPYWLLKRLEKDSDRKDAEKRWKAYWEEKHPNDTDDDDWDRLYLPFGKDNAEIPLLNMPSIPLLWDSPHVTRRIAAQRSRIMIFGTDPLYLLNLEQERDSRLVAINIAKDSIVSIRQELRDAGITESVVFPDLDGLGRELKQQWKLRS